MTWYLTAQASKLSALTVSYPSETPYNTLQILKTKYHTSKYWVSRAHYNYPPHNSPLKLLYHCQLFSCLVANEARDENSSHANETSSHAGKIDHNLSVDHLDTNLPLRYTWNLYNVLFRICQASQIQLMKHGVQIMQVIHNTVPTLQHELDHTDHADHKHQESIRPETCRPWNGNR